MKIRLNGAEREVADGATVSALLDDMELTSQQVAVERNRVLVPRTAHPATRLEGGDQIEVVTLVGGG